MPVLLHLVMPEKYYGTIVTLLYLCNSLLRAAARRNRRPTWSKPNTLFRLHPTHACSSIRVAQLSSQNITTKTDSYCTDKCSTPLFHHFHTNKFCYSRHRLYTSNLDNPLLFPAFVRQTADYQTSLNQSLLISQSSRGLQTLVLANSKETTNLPSQT